MAVFLFPSSHEVGLTTSSFSLMSCTYLYVHTDIHHSGTLAGVQDRKADYHPHARKDVQIKNPPAGKY